MPYTWHLPALTKWLLMQRFLCIATSPVEQELQAAERNTFLKCGVCSFKYCMLCFQKAVKNLLYILRELKQFPAKRWL